MSKQRGVLLSVSAAAVLALAVGLAVADDDEHGERGERSGYGEMGFRAAADQSAAPMAAPVGSGAAPVENTIYQESCGSCHMAYQPGLLPARSWDRMMNGLADHFGENAELPAEEQRQVRDYLLANAADTSGSKRSRRIVESIAPNEAPLRISETSYFKRQHREVKPRMVEGNPEVGSFSKCEACHTRATEGSYREREIVIPGYGRYED